MTRRSDQNVILVDQNDLLDDQNDVLVDQKPSGGGKRCESLSLYAPIGCSSSAKRGQLQGFRSDKPSEPDW